MMIYLLSALFANLPDILSEADENIVLSTRQYQFPNFPNAFNPSLCKTEEGYLLSFRYTPDELKEEWISHIGIVPLDKKLNPTQEPELLKTRLPKSKTPSQSEDARLFFLRNGLYLIYNDNLEITCFDYRSPRDMFLARLEGNRLSSPLRLYSESKNPGKVQQKNWVPFVWNDSLYLSYSLNPHEVLLPSMRNGQSETVYQTEATIEWPYGPLKGGTPPLLIDGEYLAFFHSWIYEGEFFYFIGAYTFSKEPPFEIRKISKKPIIHPHFYTETRRSKGVIFPGGIVEEGPHILLAYGRNDSEIWIGVIDKEALKKSLVEVILRD